MFYYVKDLQFNAQVSESDPQFANLVLQQFGGTNSEFKAATQNLVQAFTRGANGILKNVVREAETTSVEKLNKELYKERCNEAVTVQGENQWSNY